MIVQGPVKKPQPDKMSHRGLGKGTLMNPPPPHTQKRSMACGGRPECGGEWAAKTIKRPRNNQCANYWAPLTQKRHHKEHRPQRPSESSDLTQLVKGRMGECPGPRNEPATRGGGGGDSDNPLSAPGAIPPPPGHLHIHSSFRDIWQIEGAHDPVIQTL